ncbi:MAG TPA: hypothetical protein VE081_05845 [Sporichthyaceae bacterium]|nr:hypothetical protein [Sporichthyaceae bacterium]
MTTVIVSAGSAAAYWRTSGSGRSTAATSTLSDITFTTVGTVSATLFPSTTAGLSLTVTKNATKTITIQNLTPGTVVSSNPTGCPASSITVASKSLNQTIASGSGTVTFSVSSVVTMIAGAPNACQGVSFTIPITLTGAQS